MCLDDPEKLSIFVRLSGKFLPVKPVCQAIRCKRVQFLEFSYAVDKRDFYFQFGFSLRFAKGFNERNRGSLFPTETKTKKKKK